MLEHSQLFWWPNERLVWSSSSLPCAWICLSFFPSFDLQRHTTFTKRWYWPCQAYIRFSCWGKTKKDIIFSLITLVFDRVSDTWTGNSELNWTHKDLIAKTVLNCDNSHSTKPLCLLMRTQKQTGFRLDDSLNIITAEEQPTKAIWTQETHSNKTKFPLYSS